MRPSYGNCITDEVTEMPRSFSSAIQSDVAWRAALRPLTLPAIWIAPPNSSSFSVSVVLPASGCEMIANVRRRAASMETSDMAKARGLARAGAGGLAIIRAPPGGRRWHLHRPICHRNVPEAAIRQSRGQAHGPALVCFCTVREGMNVLIVIVGE